MHCDANCSNHMPPWAPWPVCVSTAAAAPTPDRVDKWTKRQLTSCPFHLRQHIRFRMFLWRGTSHSWKPFALKSNLIFKSNLLKVKWNGGAAQWNSVTPVVLNPIAHQPGGRMFTVCLLLSSAEGKLLETYSSHRRAHTHPTSLTYWHMHRHCQVQWDLFNSPPPPLAVWLHTPYWGGSTSWNSFQQIFRVVIGCSHSWVSFSPNAVCSSSLHLSPILFLLLFLGNKNVRSNVLRSAVSLSYWSEWAKRNETSHSELSCLFQLWQTDGHQDEELGWIFRPGATIGHLLIDDNSVVQSVSPSAFYPDTVSIAKASCQPHGRETSKLYQSTSLVLEEGCNVLVRTGGNFFVVKSMFLQQLIHCPPIFLLLHC